MHRIIWTIAALCALAAPAFAQDDPLAGLPRALALQDEEKPGQESEKPPQDPPAQPQEEPVPPPDIDEPRAGGEGNDLLDFDRFELNPYVGLLFFSEDFEADPEVGFGVSGRAPSPWFNRDLLGLDHDYFGAWLDLRVSQMDRDVDFLDDTDGPIFFVAAGGDFEIHRDEEWTVLAQTGVQYGFFGDIDDTEDGVAVLLGLAGGYTVAEGVTIALNPQIAFADAGDRIIFLNLGALIQF